MMHIIKISEPFPYICECFKCKCKFEFQDKDILQRRVGKDYIDYINTIYCPHCNQDINAWLKEDWLKKSWDK